MSGKSLKLFKKCKEYKVPLWQCPQFLFVVLGILISVVAVVSYLLGTRYIDDPALMALIVLFLVGFLLVIDYLIVRSFERLAEANYMKSEFVSVVSHQLRSPISNLSWALEVLSSGKLGQVEENQLEYFTILKDNVSRMKELASDLLVVSRIQTTSLFLEKSSFDLGQVVKETMERFRPFARASNVGINFEKEGEASMALGDAERTELVFENLLDNAIRYTKDRGEVNVRLFQKKDHLRVEVEDEGIGIPREEQKYVFNKFFRAKNAMKKKTQGSGLGLFIANSIIKRSGGRMGFESKVGEGTTFWFTLPVSN